MTFSDVVAALAERGHNPKEARRVLSDLLDIIEDALKGGGTVTLTGFGTFRVSRRGPRKVGLRGVTYEVPSFCCAHFRPARRLNAALTGACSGK